MLNASTPPASPPLNITPPGSAGKAGFACGAELLGGVCGPAASEPPAGEPPADDPWEPLPGAAADTGRLPEAAELAAGPHPATAAPTSNAAAAGTRTVRPLPNENLADMMITCACRPVAASRPEPGPS